MVRSHLKGKITLEAVVPHILLQIFTPLIRFLLTAVRNSAAGPGNQGFQLPVQLLNTVILTLFY